MIIFQLNFYSQLFLSICLVCYCIDTIFHHQQFPGYGNFVCDNSVIKWNIFFLKDLYCDSSLKNLIITVICYYCSYIQPLHVLHVLLAQGQDSIYAEIQRLKSKNMQNTEIPSVVLLLSESVENIPQVAHANGNSVAASLNSIALVWPVRTTSRL